MKLRARRVRFPLTALALLFLTLLAPVAAAQLTAPCDTGFINGQVTSGSRTMGYVVYVPRDYTPDKPWPVILFLHGAYTEGKDGFRPLFGTLPPQGPYALPSSITWGGNLGGAVTRNPRRFPCLVVWPQMPSGGSWTGRYEELALQALEDVVVKYNGDRSRLYLTGISLGGYGTWDVATRHPDRFAAIMPICGGGNPTKAADSLKTMPIWVFHGDRDSIVSVKSSRVMVATIQAAGNPNLRYTEYPGVDHNCWDIAYNDPRVIEWLLAQKR